MSDGLLALLLFYVLLIELEFEPSSSEAWSSSYTLDHRIPMLVRYRELSKQWHPDKVKEDKEAAQERFVEIQQAYENLSKIKHR